MKRIKRAAAVLTVGMVCLGSISLTGCGGGGSSAENQFSWWMTAAESTDYYVDYSENPVMKYLTENVTYENSEGEQDHISFEIQTAPAGKEVDNFNTLITTGSYTDIIDLTYYGGALSDLYEQGQILDLGEYIDEYMPNYKAYLEAHPEEAIYATTNVDGEEKYLSIISFLDSIDSYSQDFGFCYRRDWIVKYGTQPDEFYDPMNDSAPRANPNAGKAFSGYFSLDNDGNEIQETEYSDNVNGDSWVDDVVFPSGYTDPMYISDWEWMFEIFDKAMEEQGITDGYCMSMYYPGYIANGDLVTGFGGGGPTWYKDGDEVKFGADTESFKAYLECMNQWYENGWLDKQFSERSTDMFYRIDEVTMRSGKVGLWMGAVSTLGTRISSEEQPYTEGLVVYGARQPINDIYGTAETQLQIPYTMYQSEKVGGGIAITDKAKDKDLALLFRFLDNLYSQEGSITRTMGLSAEQMAECQNESYQEYGLEDGAYTVVNEDGEDVYYYVPILEQDEGNLRSAMTGNRLPGIKCNSKMGHTDTETFQHSREEWVAYEATGFIASLNSRRTADAISEHQKIKSRIEDEYMYINVPQFIKGEKNLDSDWETFCSDLQKRDYQAVCDGYNEALK